MLPRPWAVRRVRRELRDTMTLELTSPAGDQAPFLPGQFNMLYCFGVGEVPISLSGDPARPRNLLHTIRAVGATTRALCALSPGATVGLRGPYGTSWPLELARGGDLVIVAGGIGLAPVRPVLYEVLRRRDEFGNVALLYGTRTPRDILFRRELQSWRGRFDINVEVTVDHAAGQPFEHVGVVTRLVPLAAIDPLEATAFVCGPEVMMRFTARELTKRGVAPERVYLSLERNMQCAVGLCGHCQLGPDFVCKDGPVFPYQRIRALLGLREV